MNLPSANLNQVNVKTMIKITCPLNTVFYLHEIHLKLGKDNVMIFKDEREFFLAFWSHN